VAIIRGDFAIKITLPPKPNTVGFRFRGSKRFGGALFASAGTVAPSFGVMRLKDIHPAAGIGLRFLVFPKKDIFIRTDFALTPEGTGFYI
jgi:hypothetical protein